MSQTLTDLQNELTRLEEKWFAEYRSNPFRDWDLENEMHRVRAAVVLQREAVRSKAEVDRDATVQSLPTYPAANDAPKSNPSWAAHAAHVEDAIGELMSEIEIVRNEDNRVTDAAIRDMQTQISTLSLGYAKIVVLCKDLVLNERFEIDLTM